MGTFFLPWSLSLPNTSRVDNDAAGKYLSCKVQSDSRPLICPSIAPSLIEHSGYCVLHEDDVDDESE